MRFEVGDLSADGRQWHAERLRRRREATRLHRVQQNSHGFEAIDHCLHIARLTLSSHLDYHFR